MQHDEIMSGIAYEKHSLNISLIGYALGLMHDEFNIDLIDFNGVRQLLIDHPRLMQTCLDGFHEAQKKRTH